MSGKKRTFIDRGNFDIVGREVNFHRVNFHKKVNFHRGNFHEKGTFIEGISIKSEVLHGEFRQIVKIDACEF